MKLPCHDPLLNAKPFRLLALENLERARCAKSVPESGGTIAALAKHYMFMTESELEAASERQRCHNQQQHRLGYDTISVAQFAERKTPCLIFVDSVAVSLEVCICYSPIMIDTPHCSRQMLVLA